MMKTVFWYSILFGQAALGTSETHLMKPNLTFAYHLSQTVVGGGITDTITGSWPSTIFGVNNFAGTYINATASIGSTIGSLLPVRGTNDSIVDFSGQYIGTSSDNVTFTIMESGWVDIQKGATSRHKWTIGGDTEYARLATSFILCKAGPYTGAPTNEIDCFFVN